MILVVGKGWQIRRQISFCGRCRERERRGEREREMVTATVITPIAISKLLVNSLVVDKPAEISFEL